MAKLRSRPWWKKRVRGGAAFIETKMGATDGLWHTHAHLVVDAAWMDQRELSAEWLACTGDSCIVDVSIIRHEHELSRYVTKYVTKGLDDSCLEDPGLLDECIMGMRGRRLCSTFGDWRGCDLERPTDDPGDWQTVASLASVIARADAGSIGARLMLATLRGDSERVAAEIARNAAGPP